MACTQKCALEWTLLRNVIRRTPEKQRKFSRMLKPLAGSAVVTKVLTLSLFPLTIKVCYLLRSAKKYAPWIRHVWIVTQSQVPVCVNTSASSWVSIVDHSEIIPAEFRPVFNSRSVEANLYKIPGLSEHFMCEIFLNNFVHQCRYNNDDMFFFSDIAKSDFFTPSGQMRFYVEGLAQFFRLIPTPFKRTHGLKFVLQSH